MHKIISGTAIGLLIFGVACGTGELSGSQADADANQDGSSETGETGAGSGGNPNTPVANQAGGGSETGEPFPRAEACQVLTSAASAVSKSVDIIMIVDNSGSMTQEAQAIERNININFGNILSQSGVDYRLILLAAHGNSAQQDLCIGPPLSAADCTNIPNAPVNGARFFHYDRQVESTDSLSVFLDSFSKADQHGFAPNGLGGWLRPDSHKTFIEITDDESRLTAQAFEEALVDLKVFGDSAQRRYTFHSIIGIAPNTPATAPWLPTDPKKNAKCTSAIRPGANYEDLSLRSGGLRFPVCETSSYDAVFQAAAKGIISSTQLQCEFLAPPPPAGKDYRQGYVEYTPGEGAPSEYLTQAADSSACGSDKFLREGAKITLCPDACTRVKADTAARLAAVYGCGSTSVLK